MDGVHDLGGLAGFGPVHVEADEPVFHERWESRVFGLSGPVTMATGGGPPTFRHAIERMDPVHYLASSYYEHWLTGLATLAVERGLVTADELTERAGSFPLSNPVAPDPVRFDGPARRRFAVGDVVRVREVHPPGHTRCPDYVRGHLGEIVRVDPPESVADLEAHGRDLVEEVSYCVRFRARALWGDPTIPDDAVHVDLLDRYLDVPDPEEQP